MPLITSRQIRVRLCAVSFWELVFVQEGLARMNRRKYADRGVLQGHLAPVLMGAFTPDGDRAVTVSSDETVRLWDVKTGHEIRRYKGIPVRCTAWR